VTRAGLVGTGLLGGSVGLALRRAGIDVRGYDRDPVSAARAVELGVLDEAVPTLADAAAGADVVFVAVGTRYLFMYSHMYLSFRSIQF
jgi:prephenate dehydrogenase